MAGRRGDRGAALISARLGEGDLLAGQVDVVQDRRQGLPAVFGDQRVQLRRRRLQSGPQCDELPGDLVESGVGVDQQVAHLVEGGHLCVEVVVDVGAGGDDLHEHRALFVGGLRHVVVEALPQCERVGQSAAGLVQRLRERGALGFAELAHREPEFLGTGLDRVVGVGQHLSRPRVQDVEGLCGELVDGQLVLPQMRQIILDLPALAPTAVDQRTAPADDGGATDRAGDDDAGVGGFLDRVDAVGGGDCRTRPVPALEGGQDVVVGDGVEVGLIEPHRIGVDREQVVGLVVGGYRQQNILAAEAAARGGAVTPLRRVESVEIPDVDHPQLNALIAVEPIDAFGDLGLLGGGECVGRIHHVGRHVDRCFGRRRPGAQEGREQ